MSPWLKVQRVLENMEEARRILDVEGVVDTAITLQRGIVQPADLEGVNVLGGIAGKIRRLIELE
jgi:hypothetical protein